MTRRSGLAAAAALLLPLSARAEPAAVEAVSLVYEGGETCPSEAEFFATVRTYTRHWSPPAPGTTAARTIRVRLSVGASETVGTFLLSNAKRTVSERQIAGPTCADVSDALAVMVAVAIDPPAPDRESLVHEPPPGTPREPVRRPRDAPSPPRVVSNVSIDLRLETTSAVIDGSLPSLGASMKVGLWFETGPTWLRDWKPSFALGARQSLPKGRELRVGSAEFAWSAANLRLCPHEISLANVVDVAACAETNLGVFRAAVEGVVRARGSSVAWIDVGGSLWASVRLSNRFFLSSTVLLSAPLAGRDFALASGAPVVSAPPFGVLGGLGFGATM